MGQTRDNHIADRRNLSGGENTKLQFEYDFETGQYVLSKELGKVIDSTDEFY